ncbi:MAG: hypothetical protein HC769_13785 [Cyanobacteria bacterium CRU_2_1]|nr:hypothetical protein [Cyanobacteria bacterium CRU_2_1]
MTQNQFPPNWDEERVRQTLSYYENQTEDEAVLEDEKTSNLNLPSYHFGFWISDFGLAKSDRLKLLVRWAFCPLSLGVRMIDRIPHSLS